MNILFVAGGTAGHINPAIAIAQYFEKNLKDVTIHFAGTPFGLEATLVSKAGFQFHPINIRGFQRKISFKNLIRNVNSACLFAASTFKAREIIKKTKPDLVFGTGGYASASILLQASKMGIKTAIHEQNAHPGLTNKFLSKKVDIVFLAVEEAKKKLPNCKTIVVGNPVRNSVLSITKEQARAQLNMDDSFCILSFGGSLGAVKINEIAADLMAWHTKNRPINHIHAMGKLGSNCFPKMLTERNVVVANNPKLSIRTYIHNMDVCLAAADLVICRSGALTLAELQSTGTPSILIPSPNVAENHQFHNAMILHKKHAAVVIEEKNYDKNYLIKVVDSFLNNPTKLKTYGENAKKLAISNTTQLIFNHLSNLFHQNF